MKLPPRLKAFLLNPPATHGLVFDLDGMEENAKNAKRSLPKKTILMAIKSFPHITPLKRVLPHIDGADVSNINEFNLVKDILPEGAEVWFTRASLQDFKEALVFDKKFKIWFTLDNQEDLKEFIQLKNDFSFKISLRLSSTDILSNPSSSYISRFGLTLKEAEAIFPSVEAIHFHHGSEVNDGEIFKAISEKVTTIMKSHPKLERVNFGGGWNLRDEGLIQLINKFNFPIVLEPGRFFSEAFGYAFTEVKRLTQKERCLVVDGHLSVATSLKWARDIKFMSIPSGNPPIHYTGKILYGGPTCFEGDTLAIEDLEKNWQFSVGDHLLFHPISGYSYAWNKEFNGILTEIFFVSGDKNE